MRLISASVLVGLARFSTWLELFKAFYIEYENGCPADLDFDLVMQSISRVSDARCHRHKHPAAVTCFAQHVGHLLDLRFIHADEKRRIALSHKSTRRGDSRDRKLPLGEGFGGRFCIPILDDGNYKFHG